MINRDYKVIIKFLLIYIFGVIAVSFTISTRTPVKYAVRVEDLEEYPNSIIVKQTWHTETGWEMVGDTSGYYSNEVIRDVHLIGNIPPLVGIGGDHVNTYLCQVQYIGLYKIEGGVDICENYDIYE